MGVAVDRIVSAAACQEIVASLAIEVVVACSTGHAIVSGSPVDVGFTIRCGDRVVATKSKDKRLWRAALVRDVYGVVRTTGYPVSKKGHVDGAAVGVTMTLRMLCVVWFVVCFCCFVVCLFV